MLANDKAFHNTLIEPGPLTTSDHTPIIIKITSKPIEIPKKKVITQIKRTGMHLKGKLRKGHKT